MKQILAILDRETGYAERFAAFANRMSRCPFQVVAYTSREKLMDSLKRRKIHILLTGEEDEESTEDWKSKGILQVISLNGGMSSNSFENSIYKYQNTEQIIKRVMTLYADLEIGEEGIYTGVRCRITTVCSPAGRCGKTSFSLLLGRILAETEKTLFLSLESLSGLRVLLDETYENSLSDLFYYARQGKLGKVRLDASLYSWGELDYIPPAAYPGDLADVSDRELIGLIEQIADCGGYEHLVIDAGVFGSYAAELLNISDQMLVPVMHDLVTDAKLTQFEEYLVTRLGAEQQKKIEKLVLPPIGSQDRTAEQLLWSEQGDYVRKMVKGGAGWSRN